MFSINFDMGKIIFEYLTGKKEEFDAGRVTPYEIPGRRSQGPNSEIIAKTLEERKAWLILPKQEGELERIINPHVIKSVSIDY